jgi:hypothetical protein
MTKIICATPRGEIWLWGERSRFESQDPVVLAISGLYGGPETLWFRMQDRMPEAAVFAAQLPGHLSPELSETSLEAFARAFDSAIASAFEGRPVLVCGESAGGTVALTLTAPQIGILAFDPPLNSRGMLPFRTWFAEIWRDRPDQRPLLQNLFGFDGEDFRPLDYVPALKRPARIVAGGLFEGEIEDERPFIPSVIDTETRQVLSDLPFIRLSTVIDAGHVVSWYDALVVEVVREELALTVAGYRAA